MRAERRIADAEEKARDLVRKAVAARDGEIVKAVRAGASQTDIAKALGKTRQTIHNAVKRTAGG